MHELHTIQRIDAVEASAKFRPKRIGIASLPVTVQPGQEAALEDQLRRFGRR